MQGKTAVGPSCSGGHSKGGYRNTFICWWLLRKWRKLSDSHSLFLYLKLGMRFTCREREVETGQKTQANSPGPCPVLQFLALWAWQASFPISKMREFEQIPLKSLPAWRLWLCHIGNCSCCHFLYFLLTQLTTCYGSEDSLALGIQMDTL